MTKSKNSSKYAESVWMINKARDCITEGDPYSAKAWLLTAKSLFPGSFAIQYEEFLIERRAGNVKRCGRLFYEMMMCFSKEQFLLEELARIFHSRDAHRSQNAETIFSKEMFASLPENQQKELLLKYANHQTNIIDKCQISLLVLKRFKSSVCDQAINLIKTLKSTEDIESPNEPQNIYRKMIVFDVLPLILKNPEVQLASQTPKNKNTSFISERQLLYFLNLTMEFLVTYAMQKYTLIPMVKLSDAFVFENQEGTSCWSLLHDQFLLFATKLNWLNILKIKEKIDPSKNRPLKSRYKTLNHLKESKPEVGVFYAILQLYLYTVMEYSSSILSSVLTATREGNSDNEYILLENIDHMTQKETTHQSVIRAPKKKRKADDSGGHSSDYQSGSEDVTVIVHPNLIGQVNETLGECLQVAIETKHLLNTYFYDEYQQVSDDWNMSGWDWIRVFENDSLLYLGKPKQSIEFISSRQRKSAGNKLNLKEKLQLSSAHFCAGHKKAACEHALDALSYIPSSSFENSSRSDGKRVNKPDGRSLLLLSNNHNDILTYVVQVMFAALKARLYTDDPNRDLIIGHLIVLCQMMWEVNEKFFLHLLKLIQAQDGGFSYEFFFTYIIHVDILEEFAFLHSMDSVVLCLTSNTENLSKKTVTRGVGRETQTDFKTSMRKQISRCNEPIRKVIHDFLLTEKESILKVL